MVCGRPEDPGGKPLDFIEAGKLAGIKPDVARRYLDRPDVIALLRAERRAFREAVCAGNESGLRKVRDTSENGMAVIGAVRALEQIGEDDEQHRRHSNQAGLRDRGFDAAGRATGPLVYRCHTHLGCAWLTLRSNLAQFYAGPAVFTRRLSAYPPAPAH
jgi:hypothetical protein